MEAMKKDPAVKDTITDPQTLKVFHQLYFKNSPEACDYGLWDVSGHMFAEVSVPLFSVSFEDLVLFDVGSCLVALLNVWVHLCWKEQPLSS